MTLHFEQELNKLKQRLLTMAGLAEAAVNQATQAVLRREPRLAERVKDEDDALDQLEIEIDDAAITLLAQAPLASQLRFITVVMKISRDLERIGDEATTISRRALELCLEPPMDTPPELAALLAAAVQMLDGALNAFIRQAPAEARAIPPQDRAADALHRQIQRSLVRCMLSDSNTITRSLALMTVSKSLERVADHATNIAEDVVYLYEALDIRHVSKEASL
jgi:phosphate transport system protein